MRKLVFNKIEFQNFKNVTKKKTFEFGNNGLYLITGKNGSGKSTIFNAISACLFRKIETNNETVRITDLINETVNKDLHISLYLTIIDNNIKTDYRIDTYYNHNEFKNKTIINVFKENKQHEIIEFKKVDETINYIENNIIKYDVYNNIINYYQQNFNTFATKTDSQQKEFFDYIVGFEFFDNLREKAKEKKKDIVLKLSDYNNNIQIKRNNISNFNDMVQQKNNDLKHKLMDLDETIKTYENELKNFNIKFLKDEVKALETKDADELNIYMSKLNNLNNEINKCNSDISEISNNIKIKQENLKNNIDMLKADFENNKKDIFNKYQYEFQIYLNEKTKEKNSIENEMNKIDIKIKEYENSKQKEYFEINENFNNNKNAIDKKLDNYINELNKKYDNLINDLQNKIKMCQFEINSNNENINKINNSLNIEDSTCPFCLQRITEEHKPKLLSEKNNILNLNEKIKENIFDLEKQIEEYKNEKQKQYDIIHKNYNQKINEENENKTQMINELNNKYVNIVNNLKNELNNLTNSLKEFDKYIRDENNKYKEIINEEVSKLENIFNNNLKDFEEKSNNEIKLLYDMVKKFSTIYDNLNGEKNELSKNYEKIRDSIYEERQKILNKIDEYNELENKIKQLNNNKEIYESETNNICEKLKQNINTEEKEILHLNSLIEDDKKYSDILDFWIDSLGSKGIKSNIIASILPFINKELNDILKKIPGEPFKVIVTLKESNDMLKFNFEIQNYRSGSIGYKKQSGGEKRIIDFAFLLTLRKLYSIINNIDINVILLDEFFDALDSDNSNSILELLKIISMDTSIYIISHMEEWKNNQIFDENINVGGQQ